ncbi:MAG: hypothetical protein JWR26_2129 [Pedosphaera sp.]|nr:hypothetical protein [Pedosphaera sp.]
MKIRLNSKPDAGAFTLAEVCVAVAMIGVMMIALFSGFRQSFKLVGANRENLRATQILQEKMELIRLYNWDQVTNTGYIPQHFSATFDPTVATNIEGAVYTGSVTLTNAPMTETYSTNMRIVILNLSWTSSGVVHSRSMTTFISRYGLQNYIY